MATSGGEELLAACHALFGALWLILPVLLRGGVRVFEPPAPLPLAFARYALRSVVNKHSLKRRVFSTTLTPPRSRVFLHCGWKSLWARRHLQLIVNALNFFSLMLNGLAE